MRKKIGISVSNTIANNIKLLAVLENINIPEYLNEKISYYINNNQNIEYNYNACTELEKEINSADSNLNFRIDLTLYDKIEIIANTHFRSLKQEIKLIIYSIYLDEIKNEKIKAILKLK